MTDWKTVHGSIEPKSPDTTSSAHTVYLRRNIRPENEEGCTGYVYEEMTYTRKEWEDMTSPAQQEIMRKQNDIELAIAML